MGYRAVRQLIILTIVFTFFAGSGFLIYTQIRPEPTCFDNTKNQNEEGIDCGGPCLNCEFKTKKPIQIYFANFVEIASSTYEMVAQVRNPNPRLAADSFLYEFKLFDKNGVAIDSVAGKSFLYPGETAHIVEFGIKTAKEITKVEFSIDDAGTEWILSNAHEPDIIAGSKSVKIETPAEGKSSTHLYASLSNRSPFDYENIRVSVLVKDENQNIRALNKTLVKSLKNDESVELDFIWPGAIGIDADRVLIEPRVGF